MKISIMQPYIFPYIGYYQMIKSVDIFCVYDDVSYIKKGWINRNKILVNSNDFIFTIPVKNVSQNRKINEHFVSDEYEKWKHSFNKTIFSTYGKSKYYNEINSIIQDSLNHKNNISDICTSSLKNVCDYLDIQTKFIFSSNIKEATGNKSKRLINICHSQDADVYINSIGGQELYTKQEFKDENIDLYFLKCNQPMKYLSIIDVLMKYGKNTKNIINEYELI